MQKKNDNEVVLKIGSFDPFSNSKTTQEFSIKIAGKKQGELDILQPDWSIVTVNYIQDPKLYNSVKPLKVSLSRRTPEVRVYRADINDVQLDEVISLLKRTPYVCDLNNPTHYDRVGMTRLGQHANTQYFFEDLRATKKENVNSKREAYSIGNVITNELSGDEKKLRDALYLVGEEPTLSMNSVDLESLLWEKVTEEGSDARKTFVKIYISKDVDKKRLEVLKYFKKGVSLGLIKNKVGVYMLADSDRLGMDESECVSYLMEKENLYKFLVNQVSNKSNFEEDIDSGRAISETANGVLAEKEAQDAQWKFLKEAFKDSFGWKNAGSALKGMTLEAALNRYAEECSKVELENIIPDMDTLAKLSAGVTA